MVALCQQIEVGDFEDSQGHKADMLAAYQWALRELEALGLWPAPPPEVDDIPVKPI